MWSATCRTADLSSALLEQAEPGDTLSAPALLPSGVGLQPKSMR